MTPEQIRASYQKRYDENKTEFDRLTVLSRQFSVYRIIIFLITASGVYVASHHGGPFVVGVFAPGLLLFAFLVRWHNRIIQKKILAKTLMEVNEVELKVLDHDFTSFDDGQDLNEVDHPYTHDLDVFGKGSLFQYLNRCVTLAGRARLGDYLKFPDLSRLRIRDRQEAVEELAPLMEERQNFQVQGKLAAEQKDDTERLKAWMDVPAYFDRPWFRFLLIFNPAFVIGSIIGIATGHFAPQVLLFPIFLSLSIVGNYYKRINKVHDLLDKQSGLLKKYQVMFDGIENQHFRSSELKDIQEQLKTPKSSASAENRKLSTIARAFENRNNFLVAILLNVIFLWDILQSVKMERWRDQNKAYFNQWLEALSHFDALNSLATLRYNRPDLHFPEIAQDDFVYEAKGAGHLLIPVEKRVDNPIEFNSWKEFQIITGANMAGKSTYLRTVGSNLILAMAGAPVCAQQLRFSPVQIFTSIKTHDSLLENESYFFAELKRLKAIITRLEKKEKLFIILDEILKGTNSKDKQTGSMALVEQLIELGASGIIATHDLVLGTLVDRFPEHIKNRCFEVEFQNNRLIFDYQLKNGVSQNLNATFLMKQMGITV